MNEDVTPQDVALYMENYTQQWRGNKASSITSVHVDHILQFCEKHFDLISQRSVEGINLRQYYKTLLKQIEDDIKFDAKELKQRFVNLIDRDHSLLEEDKILEMERERLKSQQEDELLQLIKEK